MVSVMAQFDVYPNPSSSAKQGMPYVVVVQSDLLESLATRLVIPLASQEAADKTPEKLSPAITVKGQSLRALAHYAAPLPKRELRKALGNVSAQSGALIAAMDVVLSGV
jgi:toxin CcdB